MNVASLELCKELYELSGWDETPFTYQKYHTVTTREGHWESHRIEYGHKAGVADSVSAYDLGYLLRKLPIYTVLKKSRGEYWVFPRGTRKYVNVDMQKADTPEDAAAKLCIELFKQGVLK